MEQSILGTRMLARSAGSSSSSIRAGVSRLVQQRPARGLLAGVLFYALWLTGIAGAVSLGWLPIVLGPFFALGAIAAAAIILCDLWPLPGLIVIGASSAWLAATDLDFPGLTVVPLLIGSALATARGLSLPWASLVTGVFGLLTILPLNTYVWFDVQGPVFTFDNLAYYDPSSRILSAAVLVSAMLLGAAAHRQRLSVERLRERNAELVELREVDAARIAAEERTTIAREIHDVVAHHVSAMVIRAQAARRVAETDPDELRESITWIAENGQSALSAMRDVVRVLRPADVDRPAARGETAESFSDALELIVDRVRAAGFPVELSVPEGTAYSTAQELAILRIAREALTNVMLHAEGATTTVTIRTSPTKIVLTVANSRASVSEPSALEDGVSPGGTGIRGMRERAEALGGDLFAGPTPLGGWLVEARLPSESVDGAPSGEAV